MNIAELSHSLQPSRFPAAGCDDDAVAAGLAMTEEPSMTDTASDPQASARLALATDLTIYHAAAHKDALLKALAGTARLEIDLSAVGEIDTAGLQLLILAKREAQNAGKQVVLTGHSTAVRQAIDFCNLAAAFGDPMVIPA